MIKAKTVISNMFKAIKIDPEAEKEIELKEKKENEEKLKAGYIKLFGKRFWNKSLENYEIYDDKQKQVYHLCLNYSNNLQKVYKTGKVIVLTGKPGTGKNHLIYGMIKKILAAGYSVEFARWYRIMRDIKESWIGKFFSADGWRMNENDIIKKYIACRFLFIEEIGIQYKTDNERLFLYDILDHRYQACKPYTLTSNLPLDDFKK